MQIYDDSRLDIKTSIIGLNIWLKEYKEMGWETNIVTFLFDQIPYFPGKSRLDITRDEIFSFYKLHVTRVLSRPRAIKNKLRRPIIIAFPDFPVHNKRKMTVQETHINNGLHWHGIELLPPFSRLHRDGLFAHMRKHEPMYIAKLNYMRHIHVDIITETPKKVVRYVLKSLERHWFDRDQLLILPEALSELPNNSNQTNQIAIGPDHNFRSHVWRASDCS